MEVYSASNIINVCAKFVALSNQKMILDTTIHQTSVICLYGLDPVMKIDSTLGLNADISNTPDAILCPINVRG